MKTFIFLILLFIISALCQVNVELQTASEHIPALFIQLTNKLDIPLPVSKLNSPFGDIFIGRSLVVKNSKGQTVDFLGPLGRFSSLEDKDIITVQPGETISNQISLSDFFQLNQDDTFEISLSENFAQSCLLTPQSVSVTSNKASWKSHPQKKYDLTSKFSQFHEGINNVEPSLKFSACSSSQVDMSNTGWSIGEEQLRWGNNSLTNNGASSTAFKTWFGTSTYLSHIRNVVKLTFDARKANFQTVVCNGQYCTPNTYAYVFPTDRNQNIYLCGAYWSASNGDKGATMTHELSHFNVNGGTDDIEYGTSNCKKLAQNKPKSASINADNYAYFLWLH